MTVLNIDLNNVVSVAVLSTPSGLGLPNINTAALFSSETPVVSITNYQLYKNVAAVVTDWGANSKAAAIARDFFSQVPNPVSTSGYLAIIPLLQDAVRKASATIQSLTFEAVTGGAGGNSITVAYTDGATRGSEVVSVVGTDISVQIESGVTTAQDIKAILDLTVDSAALITTTIATDEELTAQTAPVTATNLTGGTTTSEETVPEAITRTSGMVYYFGVLVDQDITGTDFTDLTAAMQAIDKMLFFGSTTAGDIVASSGRFDIVRSSALTHTRCFFNTVSLTAALSMAAAYAGRALSTNFTGSNTATTLHLKTLAGINADTGISQTVLDQAQAAGVDVYPSIGGLAKLYTSGENEFFDDVYNSLWLKLALQVAGFNYLAQTNTKIPQTDSGIDGLKNAYRLVLEAAVVNGYCAPGAWTSSDSFGNQESLIRCIEDLGYYIYSEPIANQAVADRQARQAPVIQIAVKTAGAVHSSSVIVNVNI